MSAKNTVTIRKHALYALLAVLAAGLMFAMMAVPATAHAEKGTPYKYTVRVLAGNQGTVDGGIWETTVKELAEFSSYKYAILGDNGLVLKSDPYAFHFETRPGTASKTRDMV